MRRQCGLGLGDELVVSRCTRTFQPRLELLHRLQQPDDERRLGNGHCAPGRACVTYLALDRSEPVLEDTHALPRNLADLFPPVVDRAQPLAGAFQIAARVKRLRLGEQRLLRLGVGAHLGIAS